jgi:hypothetical protein
MRKIILVTLLLVGCGGAFVTRGAFGQGRGGAMSPEMREQRNALEAE